MSKAPKLRFKEFSGDWEEKKLGKLGEFKKTYSFSRNVEGEGNYKHIHYGDIHMNYNGTISKYKHIPSIDIPSDDSYEFIKERDIIFADASEDRKDLGKVAVVRDIEGNILSGLHTICFRPNETLNSEFFLNHSLNKEYLKFMYTRGNGAKVLGISKSNLSEYKFLVPSKEEQEKIASFFSLIDDKISLQGEKVEALKDYKSGMMQKIFSRELRFKDDEGRDYPEWEENILGNICEITTGKLDANAMVENGQYRFYTCAKEYYRINEYAFDTEALLISGNGAHVGYVHYYKGKFNAYQRTYVLDKFSENIEYIKYYLDKNLKKRILACKNEGNTPYIVLSTLKDMNIMIPSKEEQIKIAKFMNDIYLKIEKEQEKLDSLNEYKKGLLQQMFV